jgi:glycosyltransferase involved in cell wall biosynthesis
MIKLSILIPTLPNRKPMLDTLVANLTAQIGDNPVQIIYDDCALTTGAKRQRLLEEAKGDYVVFVDDDDMVAPDYVVSILQAIETNPDCVGFRGWMTTNGKNKQQWEVSSRHKKWTESNGKYYRHTLHITPVKREIALKVGFKNITQGEDYQYSMGLVPLLKTEVFIDKELYYYLYVTK